MAAEQLLVRPRQGEPLVQRLAEDLADAATAGAVALFQTVSDW